MSTQTSPETGEQRPHAGMPAGEPEQRATPRGAWRTVARREVMVKVTDKAFLLGTLVTVVLIGGILAVQTYLGSKSSEFTVAVSTTQAETLAGAMADQAPDLGDDATVTVDRVGDDAAARSSVSDGDADAWLHQEDGSWQLTTKEEADTGLSTIVDTVVRTEALTQNAAAAGTTPEALQQGSQVVFDQLEGNAEQAQLVQILGFVFAMLFYVAALTFGLTLANSVIEEKQSRIVEIIAAAIPLRQVLFGKVIGNTVLAAGQMAIYVVVGLVGLSFTDYSSLLPSISSSIIWFLVFFVAGFVALSCLWAVAGSLANRTEDVQSTSTPVTMLTLVMFFGALFLDGTWQTVVSFVPPVSAILMPIRMLEGSVGWWEPVVAMVILIAFTAVMIRLGERIYRRALLQTGGKLSLRAAWNLQD